MKKQLIEYFSFGKSEKIAIIAVILLITIISVLPSIYSRLYKPIPVNDPAFGARIDEFLRSEESARAVGQTGFDFTNPDREVVRQTISPFQFDPNTLDKEGWIKMGFSEKQASGIIKFREKGGRFRKKEDLKKLYAVSDEVYMILEPYIEISENRPSSMNTKQDEKKPAYSSGNAPGRYKAELNSADSAELVKVYGIGPATARRIIRYRERLGGFAFIEQLREVAGIDSARYEMIKEGVFADREVVRKIDVNNSTISQLRQHPYIDYYIAKAIVDNRIKKGAYASPDELREITLIYEALFNKLKPYILIAQ